MSTQFFKHYLLKTGNEQAAPLQDAAACQAGWLGGQLHWFPVASIDDSALDIIIVSPLTVLRHKNSAHTALPAGDSLTWFTAQLYCNILPSSLPQ